MPRLVLYCTHEIQMPTLHASLRQLNQEQVATAVTEAIQGHHACDVQVVSSPVQGQSPIWVGKCRIGETECLWKLMRGLYE